jgi:hypothetical protein
MYSPTLGRWMQQDPLGYVDGMSLYESVLSNPSRYTDPQGLYVNASIQGDAVVIEVGITLWSFNRSPARQAAMVNIKANIEEGLARLEAANQFYICALGSVVNPLAKPSTKSGVYPVRWTSKVNISNDTHFWVKPGDWHYVEVRSNRQFLGVLGEQNSFSPTISTHNNNSGWGIWSMNMGREVGGINAWWAAHEILHFAGLWDKYSWITNQPNRGYYDMVDGDRAPNNIMAGTTRNSTPGADPHHSYDLQKWQMEVILKDRLWESNKWRLGADYVVGKFRLDRLAR